MASAAPQVAEAGTSFLLNVDRAEKARWKRAADADGITMAEYVRRAVRENADAPTPAEIAAARAIAAQVSAAADRIAAKLDHTLARIDALLDPAREAARRSEILGQLEADGLYLDLDMLARTRA